MVHDTVRIQVGLSETPSLPLWRLSDAFGRLNQPKNNSYVARADELRRLLPWLAVADKQVANRCALRQAAFRIHNDLHIRGLAQFDLVDAIKTAVYCEWSNLKVVIARRAGVPDRYLDNLWVTVHDDGNVGIYFGGIDMPNGSSRGHYVIGRSGKASYQRLPFGARGAHNFVR